MIRALLALTLPLSFAADKTLQPFFAKNCTSCHNAKLHTADLNLEKPPARRDVLEHVLSRLKNGEMPPKGIPRPPQREIDSITGSIEKEFARLDAQQPPDPGRVTARRLNRYEYNNTVRDLLAVSFQAGADFPADDAGYGFDNIADVLSLSPSLMEKYVAAAEKIASTAIPVNPLPKPTMQRYKKAVNVKHVFPAEGDYEVRIGVNGRQEPTILAFQLDGRELETYQVPVQTQNNRVGEFRVHVGYGEHILNGVLTPDDERASQLPAVLKGGPPNIGFLEVRGPYNPLPPPPSESYRRIFVCGHSFGQHTPECARADLANLARLAYRRPVTPAEIDRLARFVKLAQDRGDGLEQGMRVAVEALLVSPKFLFRIERDADPGNPTSQHPLNDFELASRLSYFLWSSMPDAELFRRAEQNELRRPIVLAAEVNRMLADPKSSALVENFGGQWLELRNLDSVKPDPGRFPEFDNNLRADMRRETQLFFDAVIHEDRSILDFVDGPFTFVNERLAKLYGIPGVNGDEFRRVSLDHNTERSGVLTQASVLTVSSYANRTSPVIRGKYILENFLNDPPPPPPPGVPNLDEAAIGVTGSLRQQFEQHRANTTCASCHARMDPLGFGLENYDAIGRWRTHDGSFAIDPAGTLPGGKSFSNPSELKRILKSNSLQFTECLTSKLLTYGLGRGLERYDRPAVQSISRRTAAQDYRFSRLILEIVNSMPFQMRRGEASAMAQLR